MRFQISKILFTQPLHLILSVAACSNFRLAAASLIRVLVPMGTARRAGPDEASPRQFPMARKLVGIASFNSVYARLRLDLNIRKKTRMKIVWAVAAAPLIIPLSPEAASTSKPFARKFE